MIYVTHDRNDRRTWLLIFCHHLHLLLLNSAASSTPINSTSKSNSPATSSITSASRRWLMETMIPRLIHLLITSAKLTSIKTCKFTHRNKFRNLQFIICQLASPLLFCSFFSLCFTVFCFQAFSSSAEPASFACVSRILSCISFCINFFFFSVVQPEAHSC